VVKIPEIGQYIRFGEIITSFCTDCTKRLGMKNRRFIEGEKEVWTV